MKANELRIGNLLIDAKSRLCSIEEISKDIEDCRISSIHDCITTNPIKPIPLTREWLMKFGFEFDEICNDEDFNNTSYKLKINYDEEIYICLGMNIWQIGSDVQMCYTRNREILYVHQLQNLYFALTGEELKIKSE